MRFLKLEKKLSETNDELQKNEDSLENLESQLLKIIKQGK